MIWNDCLNAIKLNFRTIFSSFHVDIVLHQWMNCKFHWVNPNSWEGWGRWRKKTWRTTGRQESWIQFWPIQLADLFSNLSWLIQDDTNLKLFQDCAKLKSALLWLDSPITWESTHYLRGIVLWRLYRKTMSLYRMCAREMASFYFSIFEPFNERWFHFQ